MAKLPKLDDRPLSQEDWIELGVVMAGFVDATLQIVGHQHGRHATEEFEGADMAANPVRQALTPGGVAVGGNRPVTPVYDLSGSGRKIEPGGASQICAHKGIHGHKFEGSHFC